MHNSSIYYYGEKFDDGITFKTELNYASIDYVMKFLEEIINEECLEKYIQSLKECFDFGLRFKTYCEPQDCKRKIKLYKQTISSKAV